MSSSSRVVSPEHDGAVRPTRNAGAARVLPGAWMSRTMSQNAGDRSFFLRASRDIEYVKQHGRRLSTGCFNLLICRTPDVHSTRIGIVVGKRFGIAVRRNRAKRLFRELSRLVRRELTADHSLLVFPKRDALILPFEQLNRLWRTTLRRHGLLDAG